MAGASLFTMLEARQAPAQLQGTTLRILTWSHFIPAYDAWYDKFAKEWGDKNGVKVRVDHIPHLEIPARMAAEFAAGAGHDIIFNGSSILDPALLQEPGGHHGHRRCRRQEVRGLDPAAKSPVEVEGRIYGIPMFYIVAPDALAEGSVRRERAEAARHVGAGAGGRAHAQAEGHPDRHRVLPLRRREPHLALDVVQLRRAETDPSGDNVIIDSKEMREFSSSPRRCSTRA